MKGFVRVLMVFMVIGLTAEAVCEEENALYEQQEAWEAQARRQAEMARKIADQARQQAEAVKEQAEQIRRQTGAMAGGGGGYGGGMFMEDDSGRRIMTPGPPGTGTGISMMLPSLEMQQKTALVVPVEPLDSKTLGEITEDMHIMSQILYEKIHPDKTRPSNRYLHWSQEFIGGFFGDADKTGVVGLYLQRYGIVFLQQVDFPLIPLGEEPPAKDEPAQQTDEVWQRTQRKLQGEYEEAEETKRQEYDADRVEELKETVVLSLIHASNIRHLDDKEWAIVVVKSIPQQAGYHQRVFHKYTAFGERKNGDVMMKIEGRKALQDQPSFLMVRAQKKDIDDFAKGRIEQKKFVEKAIVINY